MNIILKPGKEKAIKNHHHWIFSGALKTPPRDILPKDKTKGSFENGGILPVQSHNGELLGYAYFNQNSSIFGRMLSFNQTEPHDAVRDSLKQAAALRSSLFDKASTNAFRLVNAEGDRLPGLIVDQYGSVLVVQIGTLGMEKLKPFLVETLRDMFNPSCIYEKSNLPSRKEEGLKDMEGVLWQSGSGDGVLPSLNKSLVVEIKENGLNFRVDIASGQKTGFFLDQREMRALTGALSKNKKVLNCFGYTGGFSAYALAGGATRVDTVDVSEGAMALARKNIELNQFNLDEQGFVVADAFEFLRQSDLNYDLVILDPPAFAKRKNDVMQACRGYKDINLQAMKKMPKGSLLLTCSCSYFVDEKLFQTVIFQAASDARRNVKIIQKHHLAPDHPLNIYHPEGDYLKSFLLYVE